MLHRKLDLKELSNTTNIKHSLIEVDIHGYSAVEAKRLLERVLVNCTKDVKELRVVHGFNDGTTLRNMVFNDLKSKKIRNKSQDFFNKGTTIIFLK